MSLPQEHVTAKLESLPKGLRDKAEAIINKKFKIKSQSKFQSKIKEALDPNYFDQAYRLAVDLGISPPVREYGKELRELRQVIRMTIDSVRVRLEPGFMGVRVELKCPNCPSTHTFLVSDTVLRDLRFYTQGVMCLCGTEIQVELDSERVIKESRSRYEGKFMAGDLVMCVNKHSDIGGAYFEGHLRVKSVNNDIVYLSNGWCYQPKDLHKLPF